jgi:hypothetical protein
MAKCKMQKSNVSFREVLENFKFCILPFAFCIHFKTFSRKSNLGNEKCNAFLSKSKYSVP